MPEGPKLIPIIKERKAGLIASRDLRRISRKQLKSLILINEGLGRSRFSVLRQSRVIELYSSIFEPQAFNNFPSL